ncbi:MULTISPECIES: cobalt-precorrin 5A hydrolase [Caloramator]|uniref:Cobalamin biosynthesis protein CbiG n=1 Tax=Caloramator australicus RC3 TaxID=857293 RepID=I7J5Q9_9CLOT|nr:MULTISPECIES: cobalt-precorrin 5A hydrolase [Caloramator]MDO6353645.1 cobalt-precorrin 5A hydrolase [Caloramator sp. CAR-1]CCJ33942.1 Cobalamin biosynthesis protein CbiG [Caloramator australicus RC3]
MIACIYFTKEGEKVVKKIKDVYEKVDVFSKENFKENIEKIVKYERIIFISAVGIAVRILAPYIRSKWQDPAVLVIDDMGRYVISLLSGHFGGANEFCIEVAEKIGAMPIVTTASDGRGFKSLDLIAKDNDFYIEDKERLKRITSLMIEGRTISICSSINIKIDYPNITDEGEAFIYITYKDEFPRKEPYCILRPKVLHVGIGCKRGTSFEKIDSAIQRVFKENNLSMFSIKSIGTLDIKKDEEGLLRFAKEKKLPVIFFSREEIKKVEENFPKSPWVYRNFGIYSVAEPCAYLLSPNIIVNRKIIDGVTVAVSKED